MRRYDSHKILHGIKSPIQPLSLNPKISFLPILIPQFPVLYFFYLLAAINSLVNVDRWFSVLPVDIV